GPRDAGGLRPPPPVPPLEPPPQPVEAAPAGPAAPAAITAPTARPTIAAVVRMRSKPSLLRRPAGLAVGLAPKERRYGPSGPDSPPGDGVRRPPSGSPAPLQQCSRGLGWLVSAAAYPHDRLQAAGLRRPEAAARRGAARARWRVAARPGPGPRGSPRAGAWRAGGGRKSGRA